MAATRARNVRTTCFGTQLNDAWGEPASVRLVLAELAGRCAHGSSPQKKAGSGEPGPVLMCVGAWEADVRQDRASMSLPDRVFAKREFQRQAVWSVHDAGRSQSRPSTTNPGKDHVEEEDDDRRPV